MTSLRSWPGCPTDCTSTLTWFSPCLIRFIPDSVQNPVRTNAHSPFHGVQRRMISVVNFFIFLRLLFFALLLLYVT